MVYFPTTIREMKEKTTMVLLRCCVLDVQERCTNVYSPKYRELTKLYNWVSKNIPNKRVHDKMEAF